MDHERQSLAVHIGRVLLGLYFLVPGISKFTAWDKNIELMQHHNMSYVEPLLVIAGITNIVLAVLLLANRYVALAAYASVLYVIVINLNLHDFWNFTGLEAKHETQSFVKNLAILAGLLVLAGTSKRRA